jgi:protein disulfide-isomerase
MKKTLFTLLLATLTLPLAAAELDWQTDLPKALAKAKAEKKMVFVNFTGSDWCGWCIKLKKEVFDTKEFADYAKDNLVLVELDFPNKKKQSEELKKANAALAKEYKVRGYPTLLVLNGESQELWRQPGYMAGGPKAWIAKLDEAKKK